MSSTGILWYLLFAILTLLTLTRRSSWGISLYMLTFYALPGVQWWGDGFLGSMPIRWSLLSALILLVGVALDRRTSWSAPASARWPMRLLVLYAINASVVHTMFASDPDRSWGFVVEIWKQTLLVYLMILSIRDQKDWLILRNTMILGAIYVGHQVIFAGNAIQLDNRIHEIPMLHGAASGAYAASLLVISMFLAAQVVLTGRWYERGVALIAGALATEVVLRCNLRAVFLSAVVGGVVLLWRAPGKLRRQAMGAGFLALIAVFAIMGEGQLESITARFRTGFAKEEERDASANNRFLLWEAGVKMISEHPLGCGGEAAFESPIGATYITHIAVSREHEGGTFAVHNGYLDIAASWGVQGLVLLLGALTLAWFHAHRVGLQLNRMGENKFAMAAFIVEAIFAQQMFAVIFVSGLKGEWTFWLLPLALRTEALIPPQVEQPTFDAEPEHDEYEAEHQPEIDREPVLQQTS